jgi:hypothetical protein
VFDLDQFLMSKQPVVMRGQQELVAWMAAHLASMRDFAALEEDAPTATVRSHNAARMAEDEEDLDTTSRPALGLGSFGRPESNGASAVTSHDVDAFWSGVHTITFRVTRAVQEDALDRYTDMGRVMDQFVEWRRLYGAEFQQSYSHLCLSGVLELFVNLELLAWTPFLCYTSLTEQCWHQLVVDVEEEPYVLQQLVVKCVLPWAQMQVPLYPGVKSGQGTQGAQRLLHDLLDYVDADSEGYLALMQALEQRIRATTTPAHVAGVSLEHIVEMMENMQSWSGHFPATVTIFLRDIALPAILAHFRDCQLGDVPRRLAMLDQLDRMSTLIPADFPRHFLTGSMERFLCAPGAPTTFYHCAAALCAALGCTALASKIGMTHLNE